VTRELLYISFLISSLFPFLTGLTKEPKKTQKDTPNPQVNSRCIDLNRDRPTLLFPPFSLYRPKSFGDDDPPLSILILPHKISPPRTRSPTLPGCVEKFLNLPVEVAKIEKDFPYHIYPAILTEDNVLPSPPRYFFDRNPS